MTRKDLIFICWVAYGCLAVIFQWFGKDNFLYVMIPLLLLVISKLLIKPFANWLEVEIGKVSKNVTWILLIFIVIGWTFILLWNH